MKMIWCGLKIRENCHVLVSKFHGNINSKTLGCRTIKSVFMDLRWCFIASWGLKGLIPWLINILFNYIYLIIQSCDVINTIAKLLLFYEGTGGNKNESGFRALLRTYKLNWARMYNYGNIATEGSPKPGLCPTPISIDFKFLSSSQYHGQHCTLHTFEQFGVLYMQNNDDKYLARPGFEPGTSRLQAPVDTNEPLGRPHIVTEPYF